MFLFDSAGIEGFHAGEAPDRRACDKLKLFLSCSEDTDVTLDVPDPYYGTSTDFDLVLDMCEAVIPSIIFTSDAEHRRRAL